MPQKRSRSQTEARFREAVLKILAEDGCGALGVNTVAQVTGSDKVLIYRYFGDLDGLLQSVAETEQWLPQPNSLLHGISEADTGAHALSLIAARIIQYVQNHAATHQLIRWQHAVQNPLTMDFKEAWASFWETLSIYLSEDKNFDQRKAWQTATKLCALLVEAELCGQRAEANEYELIGAGLTTGAATELDTEEAILEEEKLPTNLL